LRSLTQLLIIAAMAAAVAVQPASGAAQATYDWVYLSGSDTTRELPVYPLAVGDVGEPGAKSWGATWTDSAGNLWLFGGRGYTGVAHSQYSDMWKYDMAAGRWYWMGGSQVPSAVSAYPAQVGSPGQPGSRHAAAAWVDNNGHFWLFGGYGSGYTATGTLTTSELSDLWKYDPATSIWTYEGGAKVVLDGGSYPLGYNLPGYPRSRAYGATGKTASGDFLLFGGTSGPQYYNDLWRFTPSTRTWIWLGGSASGSQVGVYPTAPGGTGYPGSRNSPAFWTDASHNLWIFGGYGTPDFATVTRLNDLWRYQPSTGQFTFMGGSTRFYQATQYPTSYGEVGTLGGRKGSNFWYGAGKLWLSGGFGGTNTGAEGRFNDLWAYDLAEGSWRFMDGPKGETAGVYPPALEMKGLPAGRMGGQMWTVGNKMYLYGGTPDGANPLSDMWYHPTSANSGIADWQLLEN
jgi:N-acetylneuraminic acid mutarotase